MEKRIKIKTFEGLLIYSLMIILIVAVIAAIGYSVVFVLEYLGNNLSALNYLFTLALIICAINIFKLGVISDNWATSLTLILLSLFISTSSIIYLALLISN